MTKEILIQIIPDERTRFLCSDHELMDSLASAIKPMVKGCLKVWTTGPIPEIKIVPKGEMSAGETVRSALDDPSDVPPWR
ncbi:MAG TPA: hypothetical protein VG146_01740 [Verrucomicrobiae bacterium]|nr:hypothetical protein [Verrucomicrobiae bacterium]